MSAERGGNLLSYLPAEERQRVVLLIQRLQEETEAKNKLQALYAQARAEIGQLQLRCSQLKDENAYLKHQMHSSFSMISQVRDNFKATSRKRNARKDEDWEEEDEEVEEAGEGENRQNTSNLLLHPPKPILKSLEKFRPAASAEKPAALNLSLLGERASGAKGRGVEELRREVRALQLEKQQEEEKAKQLTQKHRLVDEIKSRYRDSASKRKEDSPEKIDISDNFLDEEEGERAKVRSSAKKMPCMQEPATIPSAKAEKKQTKAEKPPAEQATISRKRQAVRGQGHVSEDYCDVLDLINDYNL